MLLNFKASSQTVTSEVGFNVGILELRRYKSSTAAHSTPDTIKAAEERVVCRQGMDEELLLKNDRDDRSTWCLHASTWYAANKKVSDETHLYFACKGVVLLSFTGGFLKATLCSRDWRLKLEI